MFPTKLFTILLGSIQLSLKFRFSKLESISYSSIIDEWIYLTFNNQIIIVLTYINVQAKNLEFWAKVPSKEKIKKNEDLFKLELTKTKDILKTLGDIKNDNQLLIGFALETNNERENAINKLKSKKADFIVLNSMNDAGAGFGQDTNKITIFDKNQNEFHFETKPKCEVAADIINTILKTTHV